MPDPISNSMFIEPVSVFTVEETYKKLKYKNSCGHVSLLPAISKLLQTIMHNKLVYFLTTNKTLYEHQYGFRSKHSTVHPIIHLLNKCAMATNAN